MDLYVQIVSAHPLVPHLLSRVLAMHELLKQWLLPGLPGLAVLEDGLQVKYPRLFVLDSCSLGQDLNPLSRRLRLRFPGSRFLALRPAGTTSDEEILRLLYSGIDGMVSFSDRVEEELPQAIKAVMAGDLWVPYHVIRQYVRETTQLLDLEAGRKLTARESQVLQLMVRRRSNREIGEALEISERTVKFHVSNLFNKIGVQDRQELLRASAPSGAAAAP
ncbi:MAG: response regulator transcription factor [Terriglobia bacterium]